MAKLLLHGLSTKSNSRARSFARVYPAGMWTCPSSRRTSAFLAAALGGAALYDGRGTSTVHADQWIADEDVDAVVAHLVGMLTDLNGTP